MADSDLPQVSPLWPLAFHTSPWTSVNFTAQQANDLAANMQACKIDEVPASPRPLAVVTRPPHPRISSAPALFHHATSANANADDNDNAGSQHHVGGHSHPNFLQLATASASATSDNDANDANANAIGDISTHLAQLRSLQHIREGEAAAAATLRQAWGIYRAQGLPPEQYRALVEEECAPRWRELERFRAEMKLIRGHLGAEETDALWTDYGDRKHALLQREEMLLSVLPEGQRGESQTNRLQDETDMPVEKDHEEDVMTK